MCKQTQPTQPDSVWLEGGGSHSGQVEARSLIYNWPDVLLKLPAADSLTLTPSLPAFDTSPLATTLSHTLGRYSTRCPAAAVWCCTRLPCRQPANRQSSSHSAPAAAAQGSSRVQQLGAHRRRL